MAIWYTLGLVAGAALAIQSAINAQLRMTLGSALWAALVSFCVGTAALGLLLLVTRDPLPSQWAARIWVYFGGLLGALYIGATILLVPRIGAATMIGLLVAGQMCMALVLDHFGLLGVPLHPLSPTRLLGAGLVIGGVLLLRR